MENELTPYDKQVMNYHTVRRYLRMNPDVLDRLSEAQAECMRLYYLEQVTMEEAALRRGVNVSTVSRTLKRGRERVARIGGLQLEENRRTPHPSAALTPSPQGEGKGKAATEPNEMGLERKGRRGERI